MNASQLTVRVVRKQVEAEGICSFELADPSGALLPVFSAGSHIDVHIPGGLTRQYSLCNHPDERHRYVIAVLNDAQSRGGSRAMHEAVEEGSTLQITGQPEQRYAEARLFNPLGMQHYRWDGADGKGAVSGGWGLRLRSNDMARLGLLMLNQGRWNGQQIVPASWVARKIGRAHV